MRIPSDRRHAAAILPAWLGAIVMLLLNGAASAQVLDKQKLLDAQTFWDNRDWDWYKANIPFFDSPDPDINTTYYYRWELVTKHLTYGSPDAGTLHRVHRPAVLVGPLRGDQLPGRAPALRGALAGRPAAVAGLRPLLVPHRRRQPRRYSTWLADAAWAVHTRASGRRRSIKGLLPDLVKNYEGWEREHFVPEVGLFWQTGHDDGMEYNINSRQTQDLLRGRPATARHSTLTSGPTRGRSRGSPTWPATRRPRRSSPRRRPG